ncbi:MAG: class IV adenylate cyclase [Candidatus Aminicenantales bacterium]
MLEIEVKVRVEDLTPLREKLLGLGARLEKERFFEENTLYDFRSQDLFHKHQALRLRKIGKKAYLTFKGTPQKSRRFKIRKECETEVKNEKQLKQILKALGLRPTFHYKKFRTIFRKGRLKLCLDEISIGNFIEFEGERQKIAALAGQLGFSKSQWIKLDYIQLLRKEKA